LPLPLQWDRISAGPCGFRFFLHNSDQVVNAADFPVFKHPAGSDPNGRLCAYRPFLKILIQVKPQLLMNPSYGQDQNSGVFIPQH
jgi:hypothetical protein